MKLEFRIAGILREQETGNPLPNLLVRAYDKDSVYDDLLGTTTTDALGRFELRYTGDDFRELFECHPDIYLDILDEFGGEVLSSTANAVRWDAGTDEFFELEIPRIKILESSELGVEIVASDRSPEVIEALPERFLKHILVQRYLKGTKHRLLSVELVDSDSKADKTEQLELVNHYRATIYDYTNNRTILVIGDVDNGEVLEVVESGHQPLPSNEEFEAAVEILRQDRELGAAIADNLLQPYRPMPPYIEDELPDGRIERTIAVGLLPHDHKLRHEIVGVNMIRDIVTRYDNAAPEVSRADEITCGVTNAFQGTATKGTPGQVNVTIKQGNTVLWTFQAIRPAASSGTVGSGIELRNVDYRGKRVLYRAHVPILNVRYDNDACGPYRDWQYQEGMLQANGTDVAPGFRLCSSPAKTLLESGTDTGNFLGVAIYVQGQEVVLVSEMEAGWYRYVSEWRFHVNGTIRPRFGFAAVNNSCVCNRHHHHVYWRFDFDIRTAGNNVVQEYNNPPLFGSSNWHTKNYEIRRLRDSARKRRWRVVNASTGEGYTLIPGANDGVVDSFGVGDLWILRYRGSELDDGQGFTTDPAKAKANLDRFVNGESINNQDVVLWYSAHFTHAVGSDEDGGADHIVGPDLKPFNW